MLVRKPRLAIIAPVWDTQWWRGGKVLAPPLILPLLAGLTPDEIEVILIDEAVLPVRTNMNCDGVAISAMTANAPRAYEIADAFRERGIPVIMGGMHPSVMPEEAGQHADAVVIGEAEPVWKQVLVDLASGRLQPRYQGTKRCDMKGLPFPRRELLPREPYQLTGLVEEARGCPYNCDFCSVSNVSGHKYRYKPPKETAEEVRRLAPGVVGFVGNNIGGNRNSAGELFEELARLRKPRRWAAQCDVSIADDLELLRLAARSGCAVLFTGIESLSLTNLRMFKKTPNLRIHPGEAIRRIQDAGIAVDASFVFGLDDDSPDVFRTVQKFCWKYRPVAGQFAVLTPFPGTKIRERLLGEGRIFSNDWTKYTCSNVVYHPKNMTVQELEQGRRETYLRFYSPLWIAWRNFPPSRDWLLRVLTNWSYHNIQHQRQLVRGLPR